MDKLMDKLLKRIDVDIEEMKVIDSKEEVIDIDTSFIGIKKGVYKLNNGAVITREGVFKKYGTNNAICIFAVTTDGKILIITTPRVTLPDDKKISIELPAGYIESNETSIEAGLRELEEETGYTSNNIMLVDSYYTSLGFSEERIDLLLAMDCIKVSEQHLDDGEYVRCELVTLSEFEYLLNNNYIMDTDARIGYYRYLEYLMKEGY